MLTFFFLCIYSTDYVLVQDKSFKKFAKAYAESQDLWFREYVFIPPFILFLKSFIFFLILTCNSTWYSFSKVVSRLFELGVPTEQFVTPEPWIIPTVDEQKAAKKD